MSELTNEISYFSGKNLLAYLTELRGLIGEKTVLMVLRRTGWLDSIRTIVATRHDLVAPYDVLIALNQQILDIFGETGQRTVIYAAAKHSFKSSFGETRLFSDTRQWLLENADSPLRLRTSLEAISRLLEATSRQKIRIEESSSHYHMTIQECTNCHGVSGKHKPYCFYTVGLIRGGLSAFLDRDDYPVQELACAATGDRNCEFIIRKSPFSQNEKGSGKTSFLTLPPNMV